MSTKKNIPLTEEERVDQYGSFYSLYGRLNFEDADQMRSTKPIAFRDKQGQTSKLQDNWSIVFDDLLFSGKRLKILNKIEKKVWKMMNEENHDHVN